MTDREYVDFLNKCANIPYKDYSWLKDHCYRTLNRPCSPNTRNEHLAILDLIKEHEERQRQWILVSERLPEVMDGSNGECSDDVLICVADDEHITISTGFYGYYPRSKSQQGWWSMWAYGCHQLDSKYKVVAWMPLPQPYRQESEEQT